MGHLISEPKFKIPTPPPSPPANFWQVPYPALLSDFKGMTGGCETFPASFFYLSNVKVNIHRTYLISLNVEQERMTNP